MTGVGASAFARLTRSPLPASTSLIAIAYRSDKKRVSKPTTAQGGGALPGSGAPGQDSINTSAIACATCRTLAKVNSSLITARQPSVPNLIAINSPLLEECDCVTVGYR